MAFLETPRFPEDISYGAAGGPGYSTDVVVMGSGYEQRTVRWSQSRCKYDVAHGLKSQAQLDTLLAFFRAVKGRGHGFRYKDWLDFQASGAAGVLTLISGDDYQMFKRYSSGALSEDRKITKPISGTVSISGGGTYSVNYTTGVVTRTAGAVPTGWSGQFDVPCRFETDQMRMSIEQYNAFTWGQIPVWEIRV